MLGLSTPLSVHQYRFDTRRQSSLEPHNSKLDMRAELESYAQGLPLVDVGSVVSNKYSTRVVRSKLKPFSEPTNTGQCPVHVPAEVSTSPWELKYVPNHHPRASLTKHLPCIKQDEVPRRSIFVPPISQENTLQEPVYVEIITLRISRPENVVSSKSRQSILEICLTRTRLILAGYPIPQSRYLGVVI